MHFHLLPGLLSKTLSKQSPEIVNGSIQVHVLFSRLLVSDDQLPFFVNAVAEYFQHGSFGRCVEDLARHDVELDDRLAVRSVDVLSARSGGPAVRNCQLVFGNREASKDFLDAIRRNSMIDCSSEGTFLGVAFDFLVGFYVEMDESADGGQSVDSWA